MRFPFAFWKLNAPADSVWPTGSYGDLIVENNSILMDVMGGSYDWNNIVLRNATIYVNNDDTGSFYGNWFMLGCKSFTADSTSQIIFQAVGAPGSVYEVAPDGMELFFPFDIVSAGGAGAGGLDSLYGSGTGGASHLNSGTQDYTTTALGGIGGDGWNNDHTCSYGGGGGFYWGDAGNPGDSDVYGETGEGYSVAVGAGGGGGAIGKHGGPIYLAVDGPINVEAGFQILINGGDGGYGGNGGYAHSYYSDVYSGGGGGGGAGGNGGKFVCRYKENLGYPLEYCIQYYGGNRGHGGLDGGGVSEGDYPTVYNMGDGADGQDGIEGSYDIQAYS